jgi:hypothetical protein
MLYRGVQGNAAALAVAGLGAGLGYLIDPSATARLRLFGLVVLAAARQARTFSPPRRQHRTRT